MKLTYTLAASAFFAAVSAANAQTTPPPGRTFGDGTLPEFLQPYDIDGDGKLSAEEREAARAARDERRQEALSRWDTDGDGKLSQAEIEAARAAARTRVEELRTQRFNEADTNDDGSIDATEFAAMCENSRLPDEVVARIFQHLAGEDSLISLQEFLRPFQAPPPPPQVPGFDTADADDSGDVTPAEFIAACTAAGIPELRAREIFARHDRNRDGKLVVGEYPGTVAPPPQPPPAPVLPPFASADKDANGSLSPREFMDAAIAAGVPGPVANDMFGRADKSPRDMKLSPEEYATLLPPPPPVEDPGTNPVE